MSRAAGKTCLKINGVIRGNPSPILFMIGKLSPDSQVISPADQEKVKKGGPGFLAETNFLRRTSEIDQEQGANSPAE